MKTKLLKYIPKPLKNRWILAPLILLVWILLFEDVNMISIIKSKFKISALQHEWDLKKVQIQEAQQKRALIVHDIEKYARETYWMKKPNEEIFIITEKK